MQFAASLRRYKGMTPPVPVSGPKTLAVGGADDSSWRTVEPKFRDAPGDTAVRDADGTPAGVHYTDRSARNDFVLAQVCTGRDMINFHVQTAAPVSPAKDRNWMMLLIDADCNPATGWHGYDLLVNRMRGEHGASVERNVGADWKWEIADEVEIIVAGRDLIVRLPRRLLPPGGDGEQPVPVRFQVDRQPARRARRDGFLHPRRRRAGRAVQLPLSGKALCRSCGRSPPR